MHPALAGAIISCSSESPGGIPLKLWIDADAAPRDVKEIVFRAANPLELEAVLVIDHRGKEYTTENVGEELSIQDFMDELRSSGVGTGGPSAYSDHCKRMLASTLDRGLTREWRSA
ncbi:MAG: hypothetical protein EA421_11805 [Gemmatimonadales bacterium]|nr:MAG: hypothetical protein EA421_11805 [Gemmatimonadales bacterium]